ncbi:MAG: superoxide dismutase family protein, partial [Acidimicrobiales bacterium]
MAGIRVARSRRAAAVPALAAVVLFGTNIRPVPVSAVVDPVVGRATLVDATGATAGHLAFTQQEGHVRVRVEASGFTPGFHGLHLHDVGTCTAPAFTSAGPHWNPGGAGHGQHRGDLPLLFAADDGRIRTTFTVDT